MVWIIALMTLAALGLPGVPVHESVHARGPTSAHPVTVCNIAKTARRTSAAGRVPGLLRCLDFPRYLPGLVVIALECWLSSTSFSEVTAVGIMPSGGAGPPC